MVCYEFNIKHDQHKKESSSRARNIKTHAKPSYACYSLSISILCINRS